MNLRLLHFLICLVPLTILNGQEQVGLRLNFLSGISSIRLNPASPAVSPYRWEVSLAETTAFASNNYAFFRNARVGDLLNKELNQNIILAPKLSNPETLPPGHLILDFYNNGKRRFAYTSVAIGGPSFFYKIDQFNSLGLVTGARVIGTASGIDDDLSYYPFNALRADEEITVSPFQGAAVGFAEFGINYTMTSVVNDGSFNLGITAKYLRAYEGMFFTSRNEFEMARILGNGIRGSSARLKYGYTNNLASEDYQMQASGAGFSLDVGMYAVVDGYETGEYLWKIGFSIVDIGQVRFKDVASRHSIRMSNDQVELYPESYENFKDLTGLGELTKTFSFDLTGDSLATFQDNSLSMMLPAAVSIQVDHALTSTVFIGGMIHQYLPLGTEGLRRGSLVAIAPRFENKWVSLSIPVSLYNWQQIRFGAALRLGPLTIGSDHIGSWMNRGDLNGSDFYAALTLFPFGQKGKKGGNDGQIPCYKF